MIFWSVERQSVDCTKETVKWLTMLSSNILWMKKTDELYLNTKFHEETFWSTLLGQQSFEVLEY